MSRFGYCTLIRMNHSRSLNNFNILLKRTSRLVYDDFTSSFAELLEKDNLVIIHQKNLQALAIEMFKVKNNLALEIINDLFKLNGRSCNTRINSNFQRGNIKTVSSGVPQIWNLTPPEIRNLASLNEFKNKIKSC